MTRNRQLSKVFSSICFHWFFVLEFLINKRLLLIQELGTPNICSFSVLGLRLNLTRAQTKQKLVLFPLYCTEHYLHQQSDMGSSSDVEPQEALLYPVLRLNRNLFYFHFIAESITSTNRVTWGPLQMLNHRIYERYVEKVTLYI